MAFACRRPGAQGVGDLAVMKLLSRVGAGLIALLSASTVASAAPAPSPLTISYSDWPGYLIWQIAIDKGWFKEAEVDVTFQWFDYSAGMDAFSAGKLDGANVTNGDALVMGGNGARNIMIIPIDYSSGNDMVVAKPGVTSLKDLKGKKVAVEVGLVDDLLLEHGLKKLGMSEKDVTLVNTKTNDTPQVLASGEVAAVASWQPASGQAMRAVPGARPIYTSADAPGLIYDGLAVKPESFAAHRAEWDKIAAIWFRCVAYAQDPKTEPDALKIMAARDGLTPETLKPLWKGTHVLTLAEARAVMGKRPGLDSLYGSSANADAFNVAKGIYKEPLKIDATIDPGVVATVPR